MSQQQYRMTRQRKVILDQLRKVSSHPTADEVYVMVRKVLPNISLGTVYRNLEILSEMGQILKLENDGNQKHFDGNCEKHYHLRCLNCNRVFDIHPETIKIDYSTNNTDGCRIIDYHLNFIGLCEKCNIKDSNQKTGTSC